jgi:hypothetical protein
MELRRVVEELDRRIDQKYVRVEEYQDKYYFKKQIQEVFPELPDEIIYNAINFANKVVKAPRKKIKYINALCTKMLSMVY